MIFAIMLFLPLPLIVISYLSLDLEALSGCEVAQGGAKEVFISVPFYPGRKTKQDLSRNN